MTSAATTRDAARNGAPRLPDPAHFRKPAAYLTALKRRQDMYKARLEGLEDQRWNCEMEIATLSAQEIAILALQGSELAPEDAQVKGVSDELRRQRIMLVSYDAAIEAIRSLTVPDQEKAAKPERASKSAATDPPEETP